MLRVERRSVFETNSSSQHSLVFYEDRERDFEQIKRKTLGIELDYYGQQGDFLDTFTEKLSYLVAVVAPCCDSAAEILEVLDAEGLLAILRKHFGIEKLYFKNASYINSDWYGVCGESADVLRNIVYYGGVLNEEAVVTYLTDKNVAVYVGSDSHKVYEEYSGIRILEGRLDLLEINKE